MVIAVAGKGGTGKSTVASLIVRHLVQRGATPVLAVDADPNSTLEDKLGLQVARTIGGLREDALQQRHDLPAGTPKQRAVEYEIQQAIAEGAGFDLVVMGRGEGPGCYCSLNNMVRTFLQQLASGYRHVVVDNEAGMEHLSRRTNNKVDLMLVVCDRTPIGLKTACRIAEVAKELDVVQGRMGLVINRGPEDCAAEDDAAAAGLELLGCVPEDRLVQEFELQSRALLDLPAESAAAAAVSGMLQRVGL